MVCSSIGSPSLDWMRPPGVLGDQDLDLERIDQERDRLLGDRLKDASHFRQHRTDHPFSRTKSDWVSEVLFTHCPKTKTRLQVESDGLIQVQFTRRPAVVGGSTGASRSLGSLNARSSSVLELVQP